MVGASAVLASSVGFLAPTKGGREPWRGLGCRRGIVATQSTHEEKESDHLSFELSNAFFLKPDSFRESQWLLTAVSTKRPVWR